jgi:hypothetical protein
MSSRLVSIFPYMSLRQSNVMFSVFLNMTLCILLGCRFRVFLYFEISFLQLSVVCLVIISLAFFLAFFPISASVLIHSLVSVVSFGELGICVCGWLCRLVISGCVLQLEF